VKEDNKEVPEGELILRDKGEKDKEIWAGTDS